MCIDPVEQRMSIPNNYSIYKYISRVYDIFSSSVQADKVSITNISVWYYIYIKAINFYK